MICERCHQKNATVFLTQMVNGQKIEVHLCESCAKEEEVMVYANNSSFQQFLSGLMQLTGQEEPSNRSVGTCPKCHMSLEDFKRTSKLGCDECYTVFEPYVRPIIKSVHSGTAHTGKTPRRLYSKKEVEAELLNLQEKLQESIQKEDYLEAARIRDILKTMREDES